MYTIIGILTPYRHLLLATPADARTAIDVCEAAQEKYAQILVNDARGRPIDMDVLNSRAVMEIDMETFGEFPSKRAH